MCLDCSRNIEHAILKVNESCPNLITTFRFLHLLKKKNQNKNKLNHWDTLLHYFCWRYWPFNFCIFSVFFFVPDSSLSTLWWPLILVHVLCILFLSVSTPPRDLNHQIKQNRLMHANKPYNPEVWHVSFSFVGNSVQLATNQLLSIDLDVRLYIIMILPTTLLMGQVRTLKFLVPFSAIANVFIVVVFGIVLYYIFNTPLVYSDKPLFAGFSTLPLFFR